MHRFLNHILPFLLLFSLSFSAIASPKPFPEYSSEHSIARVWNEVTLALISRDYARPTVHARNLFHSSAMMYDLWTVFDSVAEPYFLSKTHGDSSCPFSGQHKQFYRAKYEGRFNAALREAISHAMYRFLTHRFSNSPDFEDETIVKVRSLFKTLGYDHLFDNALLPTSQEAATAAALGNYIADCVINYGSIDGANEENDYVNSGYEPVNEPFDPDSSGISGVNNPDRWQPLDLFDPIDQAGFEVEVPAFIGANWGRVTPFALKSKDLSHYERDGVKYPVYFDPGPPVLFGSSDFTWNHMLVAKWSEHLDPSDGVMWDISPKTQGNTAELPAPEDYRSFYADDGLIPQSGHVLNPATGQAYVEQKVPRGDYTRVLAEFWADGPHSETPPGHWFSIMNGLVHDHPHFVRRYQGEGREYEPLEWDVKAYFSLGAAMHDAAIAAWSVKGWYDYTRPLSSIRYMASLGQSTDKSLDNYHPNGIPLQQGFAEIVADDDSLHLTGYSKEHIGKIKLHVWRGPPFTRNAKKRVAGVGWLLAEQWWPYQKPTFVTPPFAGYVSGHSTFSRAAADVLELLTGDKFFPGGLGEYKVKANQFLTFEQGPSVDIALQWATYRDASDQTSLSRIWGGIHPPIDDIPGRRVGAIVGAQAFNKARLYFEGNSQGMLSKKITDSVDRWLPPKVFWISLIGVLILIIGFIVQRKIKK